MAEGRDYAGLFPVPPLRFVNVLAIRVGCRVVRITVATTGTQSRYLSGFAPP